MLSPRVRPRPNCPVVIPSHASLSLVIHIGQTFYSRLWWLLATVVLAGITEVIGWGGRTWSSVTPRAIDPFLMQCVLRARSRPHPRRSHVLSLGSQPLSSRPLPSLPPTLSSLARSSNASGSSTVASAPCPVRLLPDIPRRCDANALAGPDTIIFCSCDIIALVIQAVGGAKASIALQTGNGDPEVVRLTSAIIRCRILTANLAGRSHHARRYRLPAR